jgi:transcriptional regulator with XRE-family HTH domain
MGGGVFFLNLWAGLYMMEPLKKHPYVKLGEKIKSVRESIEQFKNIDNFSKATDIKKGNLYNYERGKTLPPIDKLLRICKSLDKTTSYLLLPLLKLKTPDKELVEIWDTLKNARNNSDEWSVVKNAVVGLNIVLHGIKEDRGKDQLMR